MTLSGIVDGWFSWVGLQKGFFWVLLAVSSGEFEVFAGGISGNRLLVGNLGNFEFEGFWNFKQWG